MIISQIYINLTADSFFKPEFFVKRLVINDENGNAHAIVNYDDMEEGQKEVVDIMESTFAYPDLLVLYLTAEETEFDIGIKKKNIPIRYGYDNLPAEIKEKCLEFISHFTELES